MADRYVDMVNGDDAENGTTPALGWKTIKFAYEYGALSAGYDVWVKRGSTETPAANIDTNYSGTASSPIKMIGWPRPAIPNTTITGADFTNGSNIVDNVTGITPKREQHQGRYVTAPDGNTYLLTAILMEFAVDGMAEGAEFTVGSKLTNVTQIKYGKIWAFIDNLDTTGTLQIVCDGTWIDNDNITDAGGGNAEIAGTVTAVGFLIDREYPSSTVTGTNGKFQIEADEDYVARPQAGIDANWDVDAIDLPCLDFSGGGFRLTFSYDTFHCFKNFDYKGGTTYLRLNEEKQIYFVGILMKITGNTSGISMGYTFFNGKRLIFEGTGVGTVQRGITSLNGKIKDCAIYNFGDHALNTPRNAFLENVNLGIEQENGDDDISITRNVCKIKGIDIQLGGTNGYFTRYRNQEDLQIQNYQKILGNTLNVFDGGQYGSQMAGSGGTVPNQRSGGASRLLEIIPNRTGYNYTIDVAEKIIDRWVIAATTAQKSYRIYLQNMMALNAVEAVNIYFTLKYIKTYDDASKYVYETKTSISHANPMPVRADANDWGEYIEIINVTPAVASNIIIEVYWSLYDATNKCYIDPQLVIS